MLLEDQALLGEMLGARDREALLSALEYCAESLYAHHESEFEFARGETLFGATDFDTADVERPAPQKRASEKCGAPLAEGSSETLGERLELARKGAGLTQAKLAKAVGIEQATVSQIETGIVNRSSYLPEMARACGVSTDWLAFGAEVRP